MKAEGGAAWACGVEAALAASIVEEHTDIAMARAVVILGVGCKPVIGMRMGFLNSGFALSMLNVVGVVAMCVLAGAVPYSTKTC